MKTLSFVSKLSVSQRLILLGWVLFSQTGSAATTVSGNIFGIWTSKGSPYILGADCTVASNETLAIQPGVTIIVGPEVTLRVAGGITAIGTPEEPIVIRGASPTNYWREIEMLASAFTNRFAYCRISDAFWGLDWNVSGRPIVMAEVVNCDFTNCRDAGVVGQAFGGEGDVTLVATVSNCVFDATGNGCIFTAGYSGGIPSHGYVNSRVTGNVFRNLAQAAMELRQNSLSTNSSRPVFVNNTVSSANRGISIFSPAFEPVVRNNVFVGCSNAVYRFGSGNLDAAFNAFFGNTFNFVGYPGIYGIPVISNQNGDPCDAYFNIFLDPKFVDTTRFLLSDSSPCIDAGDPAMVDACLNFSHGSAISDIGAYGGPDACGWLSHGFVPVITGPPKSQSSCLGGSATFRVRADGSEPLSYQWWFEDRLLSGERDAELNLVDLNTNHAGRYSVTVSNRFGSIMSVPATLLMSDACVGVHLYAGLSITGMVGRTYRIDATTNLLAAEWRPLATNTLEDGRWLFIDTNTPVIPWRSFRVNLQP